MQKIAWCYRRVTWRCRGLPSFMIIGAQKSGTSSLFDYLSEHPQLYPSSPKEVHFFDGGLDPDSNDFERGLTWYRAHFPMWKGPGAFEASPLYLFDPRCPKRISDLLPEVKLIVVLRNPTERAISHYFHSMRSGRESLPIMEALLEEESRLKSLVDEKRVESLIHHSYKSRGRYTEQLKRFFEYFPKRQVLILKGEDLFQRPEEVLSQVFKFVNASEEFSVKELKPRNVSENRTQVDSGVYSYLDEYFSVEKQALYELIGVDYGW